MSTEDKNLARNVLPEHLQGDLAPGQISYLEDRAGDLDAKSNAADNNLDRHCARADASTLRAAAEEIREDWKDSL